MTTSTIRVPQPQSLQHEIRCELGMLARHTIGFRDSFGTAAEVKLDGKPATNDITASGTDC